MVISCMLTVALLIGGWSGISVIFVASVLYMFLFAFGAGERGGLGVKPLLAEIKNNIGGLSSSMDRHFLSVIILLI